MAKSKYNATILRNKGVQVDVYALVTDDDGNKMRAVGDEDGTPVKEKRWVRFDANVMADIEDHFGSLSLFEKTASLTPNSVIRRALGICWGIEDVREVGLMMVEGETNTYSTAMGVALAIANGVDPTQAAEMLELGVRAVAEAAEERRAEVETMLAEAKAELAKAQEEMAKEKETAASPGKPGPQPGVEPDENSSDRPASGSTPRLRSAS